MIQRTIRSSLVVLFAAAMLVPAGCIIAEPVARPIPPPRSALPPPPHRPAVTLDVGYFYDALDPYGDWLRVEPYGWVWAPNMVDPFWRPYTAGRWVWTDWGWTWASNERWGWATYHYGRWVRLPRYGWAWVPDTVWGPAWVAWRHGGGSVGWAPLPPQVRYRAGVGLDWGGASIDVVIRLDWWCFVDPARFDEPDIVRWAYPVGRNATLIRNTRDATRMRVVDRRIVNEGIGRDDIERMTRRAVPVRRLVDAPAPGERGAQIMGNDVRIYRPEVREGRPDVEPRRGRRLPPEGAPAIESRPAPPRQVPEARPAPESRPPPEARPGPGSRPGAASRPLPGARPAPGARPGPPRGDPEAEADRQWDQRWLEDWQKLERTRQQDEERRAAPAQQPDGNERLERVRDENRDAAENARREQLAARERAKRRAERAAPPKGKKKNGEDDEDEAKGRGRSNR